MGTRDGDTDDDTPRRNRASLAVAVGLTVLGLGMVGGITYAALTTSVTPADYEAAVRNCAELAGETRLVDGGLGMERVTLTDRHVRACENTTFEEYRRQRRQSLRTTPIGAGQFLAYGGVGVLLAGLGAVLVRQEVRASR
ncbi:hypothetical protein [Haloarcula marina]|uniref:hypothetical protein n=1 Tax=Haloarcula marina TaxID=2961574 RepID=UPI0020B784BE|nr:hypothetical protein [Halomicroarcula marina]